MGWIIVIALFIGLPLLGWFLFTGAFDLITGYKKDDSISTPWISIDKSTHHHYHDNRSIHLDGDKILPDRDETTIDIETE